VNGWPPADDVSCKGDDGIGGIPDVTQYHGTNASETLAASTLADMIFGEGGNDNLFGNAGNDSLYGGTGADVLQGAAGDDIVCGGIGSDFMIGGTGADVFRFTGATSTAPGDSEGIGDFIGDFRQGEDHIKFTGVSPRTVTMQLEDDGDLVIHYGTLGGAPGPHRGTITLEHLGHYLSAQDFIYT
jgi:Ca2+-binding RTX toxin-like protein